ncbi:hypothetical protein [Trueperella sp. LYQ143]
MTVEVDLFDFVAQTFRVSKHTNSVIEWWGKLLSAKKPLARP